MTKLQRLNANIEALKYALDENCTDQRLRQQMANMWTGFGGLGFVLNPIDNPAAWSKGDAPCYKDTVRLYSMLGEMSKSEQQYRQWVSSLKASTLTAFYTPTVLTSALMESIYESAPAEERWIGRVLDPSAGSGVFVDGIFDYGHDGTQITAYDIDSLTGAILNARYGGEENVNVRVKGFETLPAEELGAYDLVATNVPFGDISIYDPAYTNSSDQTKREAAAMIHRYFVMKGLDALRDGGLEAIVITSNYLNRDTRQLAEVLKQARLIGAYRLPNNLFKDAGTEVGTDLLILQKDSARGPLNDEENWLLSAYDDDGCPTNLYFSLKPDHIIADTTKRDTDAYGKPAFVYTMDDTIFVGSTLKNVAIRDMKDNIRPIRQQQRQKAKQTESTSASATEIGERELLMLSIYQTYTDLYTTEQEKQQEDTERRKTLNAIYDDFRERYGHLNDKQNLLAAKRLAQFGKIEEIAALEIRENGTWQKADIMLKPIAFSTDDLHEASTPQEALAQSLNDYGRADIGYMTAMTGLTEEELTEALRDDLYWNPLREQYEVKAQFVSGDVVTKAEKIRRLEGDNPTDHRTQEALRALDAAKPARIPFDDLDFNLGERWIDTSVYSDFASDFFSMTEEEMGKHSWGNGKVTVTVDYDAVSDTYAASVSGWNARVHSQYCVTSETKQRYDGMELLMHALMNTCPKVKRYVRDKEGHYVFDSKGSKMTEDDPEKIQEANTKIEEIRQGFCDWLQRQDKAVKDALTDTYNRRFNCFVKPKYDGSHQRFPDLDRQSLAKNIPGFNDLYQSQKDCIWMLLLNGGGICDHEVGGGKTLIMCITAHEMKRLGFCHKPMIIGLKANIAEIARTYKMAYPKARILYADAKDYSAKERKDFFRRAKNNDWDCIIMSHDQFGMIPQSASIEIELLEEDLEQISASISAMGDMDWTNKRRLLKGLEKRKANHTTKIMKLHDELRKRKDDETDFAMMGIDHILVDESHQFKNLGFVTRHDRVAGLGNSEGSKRAYNLLMAIRTIQKRTGRDLGATFLSGTTVTNSLTELYSLFRYLRPKALERQGITCFDAWAAIFTKKSQEYEFDLTNRIVLKERFRYFIKVPELAMFYNEITDFRTAEDVGIDRPDKHAMLLNIKPTPDQEDFIERLMKFAKTGDFSLVGITDVDDNKRKAKMLFATDLARKMALDMRMIDEACEDHPRSKASQCAKQIARYYEQYDAVKGTQMVFSDLSTYQGEGKGFNVYSEIKRKLVEDYGIPESEIRFIQEAKSDKAKEQMIRDTNDGRIRVLFGSTNMLGTGVNAQKRVVCLHHLDTPWRPSDLEQRNGRAIRKGNEIAKMYADNKVDIIIYAVERSLDSYKFNLLHCKQTFINQLKRGQLSIRTIDEGTMDEKGGMNFAEYMALLSGNRDLLDRAKMEKQIAGLEAERRQFLRQQSEQRDRIDKLERDNEQFTRNIERASTDLDNYQRRRKTNDEGEVVNNLTLNGFSLPADCEDADKALGEEILRIAAMQNAASGRVEIGTIYGFTITLTTTTTARLGEQPQTEVLMKAEGKELTWSDNGGKIPMLPRSAARFPIRILERIAKTVSKWQGDKERNKMEMAQLQELLKLTWPKEEELKTAKADLAKLDRKINSNINSNKEEDKKAA